MSRKNKAAAFGAAVLSLGLLATGEASALPHDGRDHMELHRAVHHHVSPQPGLIFVPGHGILGEACDLPTSACPNDERNAN
jgi:hypothetical protein